MKNIKPTTGLLLDGAFCTAAIDTSGEQLDIHNLDVSSLEDGGAPANYEHKSGGNSESNGQEIVGTVVYVKKIFGPDDCENDRQRMFWDDIKTDFLYGIVRLYDGAGHEGAKALAAQIRDHHANKEKITVRFSIEGSTLERDGNKLTRCLARAVALTLKPANKQAVSALLADPNAPVGFDKAPAATDGEADLVRELATKKHEDPTRVCLGGHECEYTPYESPPLALQDLQKAAPRKFVAAAFRDVQTGSIINTGRFHDIDKLPPGTLDDEDWEEHWEDGFLDHEGNFYNRLEAQQMLNLPRLADSYALVRHNPDTKMYKALEGGGADAAPSGLTQGSALASEDRSLRTRTITAQCQAALRDWDRSVPFRQFVKTCLPDVDESFLNRFADMVDDFHVKLKKTEDGLDKADKKASGLFHELPQQKKPEKKLPKGSTEVEFEGVDENGAPTKIRIDRSKLLTIRGKPILPHPEQEGVELDEENGVLKTPRGFFPLYNPDQDSTDITPPVGELFGPLSERGVTITPATKFRELWHGRRVREVHDGAVRNWLKVHHALRKGRLPEAILSTSVLFSQLSPNTGVATHELMFAYLLDTLRELGFDNRDPRIAQKRVFRAWKAKDTPTGLPQTVHQYFQTLPGVTLTADSLHTGRRVGERVAFSMPESKFENLKQYPALHQHMVDLVNRHGTDTMGAVSELMINKWQAGQKAHPEAYSVPGLAPKTALFAYAMLGGGNAAVPDTHFTRHMLGLDKMIDQEAIAYTREGILWNPKYMHVLAGMNRWYVRKHPAVDLMLQHPEFGSYFRKNPEQAAFPAFWGHWLAIGPHEFARGLSGAGMASNVNAAHAPLFEEYDRLLADKTQPLIGLSRSHRIRKAESDSHEELGQLDEPMSPAEAALLMQDWQKQHGDAGALYLYFAHAVPKLWPQIENEPLPIEPDPVRLARSLEAVEIELRKAVAGALGKDRPGPEISGPPATPVVFAGRTVLPGKIERHDGERLDVVHEDDQHYYAVREGLVRNPDIEGLVKLPKRDHGQTYRLLSPLKEVQANTVVDSAIHGVKPFMIRKEQHDLVHGMDFKLREAMRPVHVGRFIGVNAKRGVWRLLGNGRPGYLKWDEGLEEGEVPPVRQEVLFHNLAHVFFGLGEYVPTVAVIRHPLGGHEIAVIEGVPDAQHHNGSGPVDSHEIYDRLGDAGELDRLAILDVSLGNMDRHPYNFLFSSHGKGLFLIDHGSAFARNKYSNAYVDLDPSYLNEFSRLRFGSGTAWMQARAHPDAIEWLKRLDPGVLKHHMDRYGIPPWVANAAVGRLRRMREYAVKKATPTKGDLLAHAIRS